MVLSLQGLFNEMLALFQAGNQWNMSRLNKKKSGQILLTQTNFQLCNRFKMKKNNFKKPKKPYRCNWSFESVHL